MFNEPWVEDSTDFDYLHDEKFDSREWGYTSIRDANGRPIATGVEISEGDGTLKLLLSAPKLLHYCKEMLKEFEVWEEHYGTHPISKEVKELIQHIESTHD